MKKGVGKECTRNTAYYFSEVLTFSVWGLLPSEIPQLQCHPAGPRAVQSPVKPIASAILIYGSMENSWKSGSCLKFHWPGPCLNTHIYNLVNALINYTERRLENVSQDLFWGGWSRGVGTWCWEETRGLWPLSPCWGEAAMGTAL